MNAYYDGGKMYNRYHDINKFITDPEKLQIVNRSEVYISSEENYGLVVDLEGHTADFEGLKQFIAFVAQSICELDNTAQKFDSLYSRSSQFPYDVEIVFIDAPYVTLEYWGTEENTQFRVVFEYNKEKFILKSFGTKLDVPADWEQAAVLENSKSKQAQKKSLLHRIIHWM